jgi:hypothetical protein
VFRLNENVPPGSSAEFCVGKESEMVTMPSESTNEARAELESWYLRGLQPKLARSASTGAVDPQAIAALEGGVRPLKRGRDATYAAEDAF